VNATLRLLVVTTASFALAAPAYAGTSDAPGQLKKQAVAPQSAPATPTPGAKTPTTPVPAPHVPSAPQTKGAVQKLTHAHKQSRAAAIPVAPHVTTVRPRVRRIVRRSPATTQRQRSAHTTAPRVTSAARLAAARARQAARTTPTAPAAAATIRSAASLHAKRASHRAKPAHVKTHAAPLASISSAADRVIEVIPGAVMLALTGMTALVFLLIVRLWATERRRRKALSATYEVTVEALAAAIEAKDHTTGGHIERVRRLGLLLAREVAPREAANPQMAYGFLLHDIGKLAVPDAILRAPGRLTDEQWALMRGHPEEGVRMLESVPFLDQALDVVRHHHERWDGGGYPDGLRGEEIPLWARIFAVVDALDAMTADRPYRPRRPYEDALAEIARNSGTQFDPAVAAALERLDPATVTPLLEPTQVLELVAA
jgi:HD-GYP domain-containing protein (c-di-GMP phosphodiesterase class II)